MKGTSQVMENNRTAQDIKTQEALSQIVKEFSKYILSMIKWPNI